MNESTLNPSLAGERYNTLLELQRNRLKSRLLFGAKQIMQSGYPLGATNMGSKLDKLQQYRLNHDRNLQILESNSWEGDKQRAQTQLREEEKLMQETLGATE